MKRSFIGSAVAVAASTLFAGHAFGQQTLPAGNSIIAQWNFTTGGTASTGTGTEAALGVGSSSPFVGSGGGAPNDPTTNPIYLTMNSPFATDPSGEGLQYKASTAGYSNITFTWDSQDGYRSSRYFQIEVTTNGGSTWAPVSGGVGSSPTTLNSAASISVSSTGLVTIINTGQADGPSGPVPTTLLAASTALTAAQSATLWNYPISYTLPAGAWENNPNFGIELLAIYNPFETNTAASDYGYVSAYDGLNATADPTYGFVRSSASGGSQRFAMVTISGAPVPEPTSMGFLGIAGIAALRRRTR